MVSRDPAVQTLIYSFEARIRSNIALALEKPALGHSVPRTISPHLGLYYIITVKLRQARRKSTASRACQWFICSTEQQNGNQMGAMTTRQERKVSRARSRLLSFTIAAINEAIAMQSNEHCKLLVSSDTAVTFQLAICRIRCYMYL